MNDVIQIRVEEQLKKEASLVFETYGLDLSTAIRLFLKETVIKKALPFEFDNEKHREEAKKQLRLAQEDAIKNGTSKLTIEDINQEIDLYRRERSKK